MIRLRGAPVAQDEPLGRATAPSPQPATPTPRGGPRPWSARRLRWGLQTKSLLLLGLCLVLVLVLAGLAGTWLLHKTEARLGVGLAQNLTRYNAQRILTPVTRELSLAQRLAGSEATRRWLKDERQPDNRSLFFRVADGYRSAFADHSYFVVSQASKNYYYNDAARPRTTRPLATLSARDPADQWYFQLLDSKRDFNIAVDRNATTGLTKLWFDVVVRQDRQILGIAGTGLDMTHFLRSYGSTQEPGVTPLIFNAQGDLIAYPNLDLLTRQSAGPDSGIRQRTSTATRGIDQLLDRESDRAALRRSLGTLAGHPDETSLLRVRFAGTPQLLTVTALPDLGWYVATAVNLRAVQVIDRTLLRQVILVTTALLAVLLLGVSLILNRTVLRPLVRLTDSVRAMERGVAPTLPALHSAHDELQDLSRAFVSMAQQVQTHTSELETRVQDRTQQLTAVNQHLRDSIDYASLIQKAILPGPAPKWPNFALWRPRDTVGGDLYLVRPTSQGCLFGVIDCAGHGVAGALMTMLAHSALQAALAQASPNDPAQVLMHMDSRWRELLRDSPASSQVATTLDAGLAHLNPQTGQVIYAGAKLDLLMRLPGEAEVQVLAGGRRAIGGRRPPQLHNQVVPVIPGMAFYLTTDGLLDQSGGEHGFGFGDARLRAALAGLGGLTPDAQAQTIAQTLDDYQGHFSQRDDITLLGFFT